MIFPQGWPSNIQILLFSTCCSVYHLTLELISQFLQLVSQKHQKKLPLEQSSFSRKEHSHTIWTRRAESYRCWNTIYQWDIANYDGSFCSLVGNFFKFIIILWETSVAVKTRWDSSLNRKGKMSVESNWNRLSDFYKLQAT